MEDFYDAESAHKRASDISSALVRKELELIYKEIDNAINDGKFTVTIDMYGKCIETSVINVLKSKGFDVQIYHGDQRDPSQDLIIKW